MIKTLRAIGYPRVSGTVQGENGYSLGDQVAAIEGYCTNGGIQLVAHFREVGSAKDMGNRPSYLAALDFLYRDNADVMVVTNLDRHSRSLLDSELVKRELAKHGKRLISIQEQFLTPIGGLTDDDDFIEGALQHRMVDAEQERKRIYKRCWRGRTRKANQGGWMGHRPPYEYDVVQGELARNEERWRYVRHLFRISKLKRRNGRKLFSWRALAAYMNGENNLIDPATGQRGRRFPAEKERVTQRKRLTPYIRKREGLWDTTTCRRMVLEMASGKRFEWQQSRNIVA